MNFRSFLPAGRMSGGGLSLLADLTQGGIVPLWAGESQQLFVLHAAMGQSSELTLIENYLSICWVKPALQEELKRLAWTKAELRRRRKGNETKIALARRLREETAVSLRWIAENLYMGISTHVSNRLYHCPN